MAADALEPWRACYAEGDPGGPAKLRFDMTKRCVFWYGLTALCTLLLQAAAPDGVELKPGDHICIIGNTLADRMQHDGWLETLFHSRFPKDELVFRNLGFSGDELNLRLRSQSFGTPDQWLAGSAPVPEPNRLVTRHGVRDN